MYIEPESGLYEEIEKDSLGFKDCELVLVGAQFYPLNLITCKQIYLLAKCT